MSITESIAALRESVTPKCGLCHGRKERTHCPSVGNCRHDACQQCHGRGLGPIPPEVEAAIVAVERLLPLGEADARVAAMLAAARKVTREMPKYGGYTAASDVLVAVERAAKGMP